MRIEVTHEDRIDLEVVDAQVVDSADFAETVAEVLNADPAPDRFQLAAQIAERVEMQQRAGFRDFQPQAPRGRVWGEQRQQFAPERGVLHRVG